MTVVQVYYLVAASVISLYCRCH